MRQLFVILSLALAFLLSSGASPRWEIVDAPAGIFAEQRTEPDWVDVVVRDNVIYIASQKQVNVKVFTILGQLVSQETLPAGVHRLQMKTKGIYILKIGTLTRRLTI